MTKLHPLTEEEQYIINEKGTERPFTGEYNDFFEEGIYLCKQCRHPLYRSTSKFDGHCGWPAFDDAIPGAVRWKQDEDGRRTEIVCNYCGGHLGHVFFGEQQTSTNIRHCVNSLSMQFVPEKKEDEGYDVAVLGGGCFWCIEAVFQSLMGVHEVQPGFAGGDTEFPTYEDICTKDTGHAEVVRIFFDSTIISYETLLEVFFTIHDPTTINQQGNDVGPQYRSAIFFLSGEQRKMAESVITKVYKEGWWDNPIVTEVSPLDVFWHADTYHKNFYVQHPNKPYCQIVIDSKITKLKQRWKHLLKDD